jgi:hypothetical protein
MTRARLSPTPNAHAPAGAGRVPGRRACFGQAKRLVTILVPVDSVRRRAHLAAPTPTLSQAERENAGGSATCRDITGWPPEMSIRGIPR